MKVLILNFLLFFSMTAFAINEVECYGFNSDGERVDLEIETGWGGSVRDSKLVTYPQNSAPESTFYQVYNSRPQNRRILFTGVNGYRLEIDLFPDAVPRWGRTYNSHFSVAGSSYNGMNCRFPQARP